MNSKKLVVWIAIGATVAESAEFGISGGEPPKLPAGQPHVRAPAPTGNQSANANMVLMVSTASTVTSVVTAPYIVGNGPPYSST